MKSKKMKVLVISYLPWRNDNNVGNTLSNLFDGLQDNMEFANIYFKGSLPQNNIAHEYFYISEKELFKSIFTKKEVGKKIIVADCNTCAKENEMYNRARQMRWESMLLLQDLIGIMGKWKSPQLDAFINDCSPDIIFAPLGRIPVANILMCHIHTKYQVPVISYAWDDHYSLKKKSFSPFFWGKTFLERKYIKECADICEWIYTITEPMKNEYSKYFNKECKMLYKGYDFNNLHQQKKQCNKVLRIIYMGNIGSGRYDVLCRVANSIKKINGAEKKAELYIYTMSPKSSKVLRNLNIAGVSKLMHPVPNEQVLTTMQSADILLHVEPTNEKARLFFRLSFSTKLVDYLYSARCILAVGGETAAMEYLKNNDAAVVETDKKRIEAVLRAIINDSDSVIKYAANAWNCGVRNHQKDLIQHGIYVDFNSLIS